MPKKKKSLVGWTWDNWCLYFKHEDDRALNIPYIMSEKKYLNGIKRVRITIQEL